MINLLPDLYKLQFSREYRWRILLTAAIFIDLVIIGGITLLVPSYLYSGQVVIAPVPKQTAAAAKSAADLHASLLTQTATLSLALKALTANASGPLFTDAMSVITAAKPAGVSITSVNFTATPAASGHTAGGASMSIGGMADTRNDLAQFVTNLQAEKNVTNVVVPISDYAADTSVPFTITLAVSS